MKLVLHAARLAVAVACVALTACGGGGVDVVQTDAELSGEGPSESVLADSATAATWTKIATEGQTFWISGTKDVRYGADSRWIHKQITGTGKCTNTFFGSDPAYGVVKSCQVQAPASALAPAPVVPSAAVFPLHVEAGKRYLIDAAGKPFFINGDTPWSLMVRATREQADQYLEDRRLKGVNTILVNLIEHKFANSPPKNVYGDGPFTTAGDFGTPNERYFAHADYVISRAAAKGMLVMLTPAYVGYGGGQEGWYQEMSANGTAKLQTYGQYLGNRYKGYKNILWVDGGDYNVPNKALVRAIANGIRSVDLKPHTYHATRNTAALQFWGTGESWLTVNNIYTDSTTVVSAAVAEYRRSSMPFFLLEAFYENEYGATQRTVRQQAYQAVLSGASGHLMGNYPVWALSAGWQQALNSSGARSLIHVKNLFTARQWWTLVPDTAHTMLTSGLSSGASQAVAARAGNGSLAIAYMPTIRSITIDMGKLSGPRVKASWVDPSSGATTAVSGSPFPNYGARSLRPAANNASGYGDWVLLLESVP